MRHANLTASTKINNKIILELVPYEKVGARRLEYGVCFVCTFRTVSTVVLQWSSTAVITQNTVWSLWLVRIPEPQRFRQSR